MVTRGYPRPTLSIGTTAPAAGVTFTDQGQGRGVLAVRPTAVQRYSFDLIAVVGNTTVTQGFTLTAVPRPTFTWSARQPSPPAIGALSR